MLKPSVTDSHQRVMTRRRTPVTQMTGVVVEVMGKLVWT